MTQTDKDAAANEQLWKRNVLSRPAGGDGIALYDDTTLHSSLKVYAIQCLTDTVFATLTAESGFTATNMTAKIFPAGTVLFGRFTAVQLTSGSVVCNLTD